MKIKYDKEVDIMTIELSEEDIDYAKEAENMIIHFSKENRPVLVEIMDASEFVSELSGVMSRSEGETVRT
ncbi:MAG: DUF2283 domain-containing protein [Halobacteriota archaeon]